MATCLRHVLRTFELFPTRGVCILCSFRYCRWLRLLRHHRRPARERYRGHAVRGSPVCDGTGAVSEVLLAMDHDNTTYAGIRFLSKCRPTCICFNKLAGSNESRPYTFNPERCINFSDYLLCYDNCSVRIVPLIPVYFKHVCSS